MSMVVWMKRKRVYTATTWGKIATVPTIGEKGVANGWRRHIPATGIAEYEGASLGETGLDSQINGANRHGSSFRSYNF